MDNSQKVIVIGGVGSGTNIVQAIKDANLRGDFRLSVAGYMSHDKDEGELIEDTPVFCKQSKENVLRYSNEGFKFLFALHRMDGGNYFHNLYYELGLNHDLMATFVHPLAYVAPNVQVGKGCAILPFSMISASSIIGNNTLLMCGVMIGHNSKIGEFNHLAAQSIVGSYVTTGIGVHTGLNSTIREYLTIGHRTTLGMGAVLLNNTGSDEMWVGNPAHFLRNAK